jgi:hypothetical protein
MSTLDSNKNYVYLMFPEQCYWSRPTSFELSLCEIIFASRCININWSRLTTILLIFAVSNFEQYNFVDLRFTCYSIEWSMTIVVLPSVPLYIGIYMFMSPNVYVSSYDRFHISFLYIETLISFLTSSFYMRESLLSLPLFLKKSFRN